MVLFCFSGGGKSTVLSMILRLYDPVSGDVKLDGANIKKFAHIVLIVRHTGRDLILSGFAS